MTLLNGSLDPLSSPPSRLANGITRRSPHSTSDPAPSSGIRTMPTPLKFGASPLMGRKRELRWEDGFFRMLQRSIWNSKHVIAVILVVLFPIAWMTLHRSLLRKMDSYQGVNEALSIAIPPQLFSIDSTLFRESEWMSVQRSESTRSLSRLESFDPFLNPVVPKSVYKPKSSNPLQVLYVGKRDNNNQTDGILDALQRSFYTKVCSIFLYDVVDSSALHQNPSKLYHEQWHVWDPVAPMALVVDWSALTRDCHTLFRILSHLHTFVDRSAEYYVLLLDASASPRSVTCERVLDPLLHAPPRRIRWAKRSIVHGRRWNHTRQWIEPGASIPQLPSSNILHWSGQVPETFYQALQHALTGASDTRPRTNQNRPVDVSHYWMASTSSSSSLIPYHYYYNRLRRVVSEQLNRTYMLSFPKDSSRWMELVGMDAPIVDVVELSGSSDPDQDDEALTDTTAWSIHAAWLASSKIVVVTQADEWEDHDDRLMEALASGALVLCDAMVAPIRGLIHKTNIVFFDSLQELDRYLLYYLDPKNEAKRQTIGRHGMEFALGRHRSWHALEALLFGKALSRTDRPRLLEVDLPLRPPSIHEPPILIAI